MSPGFGSGQHHLPNPLQAIASQVGQVIAHLSAALQGRKTDSSLPRIDERGHNVSASGRSERRATRSSDAAVPVTASTGPVTRESLGRSTWALLHTLAAQYPDSPDKRMQKDVTALIDALTRIYPCADCADHFKKIVRAKPPKTGSGQELRQWMCEVHNLVNEQLQKPPFNCGLVDMRWGALECDEAEACALVPQKGRRV